MLISKVRFNILSFCTENIIILLVGLKINLKLFKVYFFELDLTLERGDCRWLILMNSYLVKMTIDGSISICCNLFMISYFVVVVWLVFFVKVIKGDWELFLFKLVNTIIWFLFFAKLLIDGDQYNPETIEDTIRTNFL